VIRLLLNQGAQTEAADKDGQTPLWYAVDWGGNEAVIQLLLDRGAQVEAAGKEGQTPLSHAAKKGYENVVRLLQLHGAKSSLQISS
jgi:ankyrin repeat protein